VLIRSAMENGSCVEHVIEIARLLYFINTLIFSVTFSYIHNGEQSVCRTCHRDIPPPTFHHSQNRCCFSLSLTFSYNLPPVLPMLKKHDNTHTTILWPSWILSGTTQMRWHQKGKTRKVKPIWIYWSTAP